MIYLVALCMKHDKLSNRQFAVFVLADTHPCINVIRVFMVLIIAMFNAAKIKIRPNSKRNIVVMHGRQNRRTTAGARIKRKNRREETRRAYVFHKKCGSQLRMLHHRNKAATAIGRWRQCMVLRVFCGGHATVKATDACRACAGSRFRLVERHLHRRWRTKVSHETSNLYNDNCACGV